MTSKTRQIEIDSETADALETHARERGISLSEFLAEIAWDRDIEELRKSGLGPWSKEAFAEDDRRFEHFQRTREGLPLEEIEAWLNHLGTDNALPLPKARKL